MFTKIFWKDAIERAIRTFAQGFLSITTLDSTGAMSSNWKQALLAGGVAAILSIVMSLARALHHL